MLLLLAAFLADSPERELVVYYCKSSGSPVEFSLAYYQRGTTISDVLIVDRNSPRLPPDHPTRWRATPSAEGVTFRLHHTENGVWTTGEMELRADPAQPNHFDLTWSSVMGAVGGHLPIGTPEQSAECVPYVAANN